MFESQAWLKRGRSLYDVVCNSCFYPKFLDVLGCSWFMSQVFSWSILLRGDWARYCSQSKYPVEPRSTRQNRDLFQEYQRLQVWMIAGSYRFVSFFLYDFQDVPSNFPTDLGFSRGWLLWSPLGLVCRGSVKMTCGFLLGHLWDDLCEVRAMYCFSTAMFHPFVQNLCLWTEATWFQLYGFAVGNLRVQLPGAAVVSGAILQPMGFLLWNLHLSARLVALCVSGATNSKVSATSWSPWRNPVANALAQPLNGESVYLYSVLVLFNMLQDELPVTFVVYVEVTRSPSWRRPCDQTPRWLNRDQIHSRFYKPLIQWICFMIFSYFCCSAKAPPVAIGVFRCFFRCKAARMGTAERASSSGFRCRCDFPRSCSWATLRLEVC